MLQEAGAVAGRGESYVSESCGQGEEEGDMSFPPTCGVKTYQLMEAEGEREAECETGIQTGTPVEKSVLGVKGRLVWAERGQGALTTPGRLLRPSAFVGALAERQREIFQRSILKRKPSHTASADRRASELGRDQWMLFKEGLQQQQAARGRKRTFAAMMI